ncbi:uncharacterized protein ACNS7B_018506 [Menidia menidia]
MERPQRHLLLQVWCSLLTVAVVVMATLFASNRPKWTETPENINLTGAPPTALRSCEPASFIQLTSYEQQNSWENLQPDKSDRCSLCLRGNGLLSTGGGHFFVYAQVAFGGPGEAVLTRRPAGRRRKPVVLLQLVATATGAMATGAMATGGAAGPVWGAKLARLGPGDSLRLNITGDYERENTYWGAFQIR